jgi:hypothetical protein
MCCGQSVFRSIWCVSLPDLSLYAKVYWIHIMIITHDLAAQCLLMDVAGRRNLSPDDRVHAEAMIEVLPHFGGSLLPALIA